MAKTHGTNTKVVSVATIRPPITARPRGAFCVSLSDIGKKPRIMASAVVRTGRIRA
jgi:hypothetical protein